MHYHLEIRSYNRPLSHPLITSYGTWQKRSGLIIKLANPNGQITFGEIAPLPLWGTETIEEAINFLGSIKKPFSSNIIDAIPDHLPCCQFALSSALYAHHIPYEKIYPCTQLISLTTSIDEIKRLNDQGFSSFKFKIGNKPLSEEHNFIRSVKDIAPQATLRLDANASLSLEQTKNWLTFLEDHPIEFLEQPLPIGEERFVLELENQYTTPIALDESASSFKRLAHLSSIGFKGPRIIKPSTLGHFNKIKEYLSTTQDPIIISTTLETTIGIHAGLKLSTFIKQKAPLGYGVGHLFQDSLSPVLQKPEIESSSLTQAAQQFIWDQLEPIYA